MANDRVIEVTVVYSPAPRDVREVVLQLTPLATVLDALQGSGLLQQFPSLDLSSAIVGVWGRKSALAQPLQDKDRVEIYRPLVVDPKTARRQRFAQQGARTAGLFARNRASSKTGQ